MKKSIPLFITALLVLPGIALAQAAVTDYFSLESTIFFYIKGLEVLFWSAAIAVFFWGIVKFINNANDEKAREEGKKYILWGLISFVVLVSLWALVSMLSSSVNPAKVCYVDKNGTLTCP